MAKELERHGIETTGRVYRNLAPARLYEESFARKLGALVHMGAIATITSPHTGRSPKVR
jgi:ATP-dependent phosphoenolpyruvate carboxykinase